MMMRKVIASLLLAGSMSLLVVADVQEARAQTTLNEGFDNVSALPGEGWAFINNSEPGTGTSNSWIQGQGSVLSSQDYVASGGQGDPNAYIISTTQTTLTATGALSNWLITPELNFSQGGSFSFYTRQLTGDSSGNQLQVLLSASGSSLDVGTTASSVGVFTTTLTTIGDNIPGGYAYPGVGFDPSPDEWVQYTVNVAASASTGRIGFRHYAPDGAIPEYSTGVSTASFIGVDTLSSDIAVIPEPTVSAVLPGLSALGLVGFLRRQRRQMKES